jgi:hypothetical protein
VLLPICAVYGMYACPSAAGLQLPVELYLSVVMVLGLLHPAAPSCTLHCWCVVVVSFDCPGKSASGGVCDIQPGVTSPSLGLCHLSWKVTGGACWQGQLNAPSS